MRSPWIAAKANDRSASVAGKSSAAARPIWAPWSVSWADRRRKPSLAPNRAATPDLIGAGSYPFTSAAGVALKDMSSGTTQLVAASQDDTASAVTNIGFEYWYDGARASRVLGERQRADQARPDRGLDEF